MSDLREAAERYRNSDYEDNVGGSFHRQEDAETLAEAYLAGPAWQDKPTCNGQWLLIGVSGEAVVVFYPSPQYEIYKSTKWLRRCYGPIPSDEAGGEK